MRQVTFDPEAWAEYALWENTDKKIARRINELISDCLRLPFEDKGHPEMLKHELSGMWSRRITQEQRLVCIVTTDATQIAQYRYHY